MGIWIYLGYMLKKDSHSSKSASALLSNNIYRFRILVMQFQNSSKLDATYKYHFFLFQTSVIIEKQIHAIIISLFLFFQMLFRRVKFTIHKYLKLELAIAFKGRLHLAQRV